MTASGVALRLGRLFDRGSGRSFIAAIDHGITLGVPTGAERAIETVASIVGLEPDAILVGPGMADKAGHLFAHRGAPAMLVRGDFFVVDNPIIGVLREQYRPLITPTEAAALGADAIVVFLMLGTRDGRLFGDNVRVVASYAQEAHRVGLPLIVEAVLWGDRIENQRDAEMIAFGSRMAAEFGADAIKTEYTGDVESMRMVVETCPVPVLVLGGPKSPDPTTIVTATRGAMAAGARGVIYGRNLWGAADPAGTARQLRDIIHGTSR